MSNINKIAKGSVWITFGRASNAITAAVSIFVITRFIDPDQYGVVLLAGSFFALTLAMTELSTSNALYSLGHSSDEYFNTAWTINVARGVIVSIVLLLLSYPIGGVYGDFRVSNCLVILSVVPVIDSLKSPGLYASERALRFNVGVYVETSASLAAFLCSAVSAYLTQSYLSLATGMVVGRTVGLLVSYWAAPFVPRFSTRNLREVLGQSLWLTAGQIVNSLNYQADQLFIGGLLGKIDLSYYTIGGRMAQLPGRETTRPLVGTLLPAFSTARSDIQRLTRMYCRSQRFVTAVAMPISIMTALYAETIIRNFMAANWHGATFVTQVIATTTAFETLGSLVTPLAVTWGKTKQLFYRDLFKFLIRATLLVGGAYTHGFAGLILARAIAGVFGVLVDMFTVREVLSLSIWAQFKMNWRTVFSTVAMSVGFFIWIKAIPEPLELPLYPLWLAASVMFVGTVYVIIASILWVLSGKPQGPELDAFDLVRRVYSKASK